MADETDRLQKPLSHGKLLELERRSAEDDADPDGGIPWEVVKAEALARLKSKPGQYQPLTRRGRGGAKNG